MDGNMFLGNYKHSVDKKNRVKLPSNLRRKVVDDSLILTKGENNQITVFTHESWENYISPIKEKALHNKNYKIYLRAIFASAEEVSIDSQGRIRIPPELSSFSKIDDEVIIVGIDQIIELWNPDNYEKEMVEVDEKLAEYHDYIAKEEGFLK
ncbi:MAG: division/cell wall cluster transcriptional repressor MraZ [Candidatus Mcinerneyibacterium aminivorans]|jgi:MraZ protein|uniref:Transcriptional regulator MraZ n=1 Tax=Candidatus Mcinerneyibacterium aminivorans TaxID=2703815 RepID=A0A5D0MA74_9BACT|nr:MAG: division/cell wall cluster transcriptional repressor MraZ [Candidatus Mcinerneyibacterium aminivorans]